MSRRPMKTYRQMLKPIRTINQQINLRQDLREFEDWRQTQLKKDATLAQIAEQILENYILDTF
jgi:hypothetical protein